MFLKIKNKMKTKLFQEIFMGIVRHGLSWAGGLLVANGYANASTEQQIIGAGITLAGILWSWIQKKTANTALVNAQINSSTQTK